MQRYRDNYEVKGNIVKIKNLINDISKELIFVKKLKFQIGDNVDFIKMKESYIRNVLKNIIYRYYKNSKKNIITVDIFKTFDQELKVDIIAFSARKIKDININDIELKFMMELHNGKSLISHHENRFSVTLIFPAYRLQKACKPDSVNV